MTFIARGAEAVLFEEPNGILKERVTKGYRQPELDEQLRTTRTALEARLLSAARRAGVNVPRVLESGKQTLLLEKIEGTRVTELLAGEKIRGLGGKIGEQVRLLHMGGIAHGDLTTSNILWGEKLWLIDFGLGKASASDEEKAVDVFLFSDSLKAIRAEWLWRSFLKAYGYNNSSFAVIMQKYQKIALRRRYKGGL